MSWSRAPVVAALTAMLGEATAGDSVTVYDRPPMTFNPLAVVIHRPNVNYSAIAFGIDEATLPLIVASGVEQEDALDALKETCRQAVLADQSLRGAVQLAYPSEERNWRNYTGAGGIQILQVELVLTIHM
jgi:hypothetical protein